MLHMMIKASVARNGGFSAPFKELKKPKGLPRLAVSWDAGEQKAGLVVQRSLPRASSSPTVAVQDSLFVNWHIEVYKAVFVSWARMYCEEGWGCRTAEVAGQADPNLEVRLIDPCPGVPCELTPIVDIVLLDKDYWSVPSTAALSKASWSNTSLSYIYIYL